jgi:protocatechuate 3,4-dioxygenase beta subunit
MRPREWIVIIVGLLICGVCRGREDQGLFISGRVVDYQAQPVADAEVAVYQKEYLLREYTAQVIAPIVRTDQQGAFALRAQVTSQYNTFIVARKAGLAMAWDGLNYSSNTLAKGYFLLVMEKPHVMTGMVVDHEGNPLSGARVQALPKTSYMSRLSQRPMMAPTKWFGTETDSLGQFHFGMFSADVSADFWVQAPGLRRTYTFTTHAQNRCGFEVWRKDICLALPEEQRVVGHIRAAKTDRPVAGLRLTVRAERNREDVSNRYRSFDVVTDAQGGFVCEGLPVGKSKFQLHASVTETADWISEGVEVTVQSGQEAKVEMTVKQGGHVEVTVVDEQTKAPLADMKVDLNNEFWRRSVPAHTDAQGRARILAPPGEYTVSSWGERYSSWRNNDPVVVRTAQTVAVAVSLDREPSVSGRVVDPTEKPVTGVKMTFHPLGDLVYTDDQGRFTAQYDKRSADKGLCIIARDPKRSLAAVHHTKDLEKPVELSLKPALTVHGKVEDPHGIGIPAARISVSIHLFNWATSLNEEVLTDAKGNYSLTGLPPEQSPFKYNLSVHAGGYAPYYQDVAITKESGNRVEIPPVILEPANLAVSGAVVDANGIPAPKVILFLRGGRGAPQPDKGTATNEKGEFAFHGIRKGPIHIQLNFSSSRAGHGSLKAEAGDHGLRAVLGKNVVHSRFQSLVGKTLPSLSELVVNPGDFDPAAKRVLICFWDMEQRPSRRVVTQLTKQAQTLTDEGVTVVLVQVADIEQAALDRWLVKYKIPFRSHLSERDFEKMKLEWGVKSLPWLILTDTEHIVQVEGFNLAELEERLKHGEQQ